VPIAGRTGRGRGLGATTERGVVRRRLRVTGRVQGVWFRESCREVAVRLGVAGSVRNRADGTVEVVVEGGSHEVEALVAWCRSGPPAAEVTGVEAAEERPEGLTGFRVR
jgi:acylphosphatase